jgi:hypothetical protein
MMQHVQWQQLRSLSSLIMHPQGYEDEQGKSCLPMVLSPFLPSFMIHGACITD